MEQQQKDDDAAQAVLLLAEERETMQSPLKFPLKSLNARLSATKQQIQKEIHAELVKLNKYFHSTKEKIGNAIGKARTSIMNRTSITKPSSNGKNKIVTDENPSRLGDSRDEDNFVRIDDFGNRSKGRI